MESIGAGTETKGIRESFIPHKILITDTLPGYQTLPSVPASVVAISFGL